MSVRDVSKSFGGVKALDGVSMTAEPGTILGVIGPNGSGKTTLLNVVCGYYRLDGGEILVGGRRLPRRPEVVSAAGVARTFQTPIVMPDRSSLDNVLAGAFARDRRSMTASALWARARAERLAVSRAHALLEVVGLGPLVGASAETLSVGQQRMLEIARALASRPAVVLLDEPAAGLSESEIEVLVRLLERLRAAGYAIVLIEHNVHLVVDVADRVAVLSVGSVVSTGTPAEIQADELVLASYLGEKWKVRS